MSNCENCGVTLIGGPRKKYCGSKCRVTALRKRRRAAGLTADGKPRVTGSSVTESVTTAPVTESVTLDMAERLERQVDLMAEGVDALMKRIEGLENGGQKMLTPSEYKLIRMALHPGGNASEETKSAAWMAFEKLNIEPLTTDELLRVKELHRRTQRFRDSRS